MTREKLKPGTLTEFVYRHRHKTNAELIEIAKAEKVPLKRERLTTIRWQLRNNYGIKDSGSVPKTTPKTKKYKAKAKAKEPVTNGAPPPGAAKQALLRKLIFEMGWDNVKDIFLEFQEMHGRWN